MPLKTYYEENTKQHSSDKINIHNSFVFNQDYQDK